MQKTISVRKLESNRRNARLSTWPRTPVGRRQVRWNALPQGLLSGEVVIPASRGALRCETPVLGGGASVGSGYSPVPLRGTEPTQGAQRSEKVTDLGLKERICGAPQIAERSHHSPLESEPL